jgi:hypothetical protein
VPALAPPALSFTRGSHYRHLLHPCFASSPGKCKQKMKQLWIEEEREENFIYEVLRRKPKRNKNIFKPSKSTYHQNGGRNFVGALPPATLATKDGVRS